jgi:hypothetical protein
MKNILDLGIKPDYLNSINPKYDMASDKYIEKFGYEPIFVCRPPFSIEQILNAVETGVELEIAESTQTEYEL